jgi:hypothetical protein
VAVTSKSYSMLPYHLQMESTRPSRFDGAQRRKRPGETTWTRRLCCAVACACVFTRRSHQSPASRRGGTSEHAARRKRGSRAVTGMERTDREQQCVRHLHAGPQCATLVRAAAPTTVQALLGGDKKPVVLHGFACKTTAAWDARSARGRRGRMAARDRRPRVSSIQR